MLATTTDKTLKMGVAIKTTTTTTTTSKFSMVAKSANVDAVTNGTPRTTMETTRETAGTTGVQNQSY